MKEYLQHIFPYLIYRTLQKDLHGSLTLTRLVSVMKLAPPAAQYISTATWENQTETKAGPVLRINCTRSQVSARLPQGRAAEPEEGEGQSDPVVPSDLSLAPCSRLSD